MDNKVNINVCGVQGAPYTYKTVVLKPNVVGGKNILTQLMMGQTNTKYVIKYDYVIDPDIQTGIASVSESNISHCVNPNYAAALAAYNLAHDAWIDADNAYTNNPNDTTLAAKNSAYAAYTAAQTTLNNTPQYYYYAANAIIVKQGQYISIPKGCVLLNASLSGITDFVVAPADTTVYIGSLTAGEYNYTVQNAIVIPSGCLIEFDGGSISDGVLVGDETILVFDQEEEVILKNVELLGDFEYSAGGSGGGIPDKEYDPEHFSGLGRKTLQLKEDGSNILTQEDFDKENTIYVIAYDFDLDGKEITVPENCILEFDGGSLDNGTLVGNNTGINAGLVKIFNLDINLEGTWNVSESYPEWFGAIGDGTTEDTVAFQKTIDFCHIVRGKIVLSNKKYSLGNIILKGFCNIEGKGIGSTILEYRKTSGDFIAVDPNATCFRIHNMTITGDPEKYSNAITSKGINVTASTKDPVPGTDDIIYTQNRPAFDINFNIDEVYRNAYKNAIISNVFLSFFCIGLENHSHVFTLFADTVRIYKCNYIGFNDGGTDNIFRNFYIEWCEKYGMALQGGGNNKYSIFKIIFSGKSMDVFSATDPSLLGAGLFIEHAKRNQLNSFEFQDNTGNNIFIRGNNNILTNLLFDTLYINNTNPSLRPSHIELQGTGNKIQGIVTDYGEVNSDIKVINAYYQLFSQNDIDILDTREVKKRYLQERTYTQNIPSDYLKCERAEPVTIDGTTYPANTPAIDGNGYHIPYGEMGCFYGKTRLIPFGLPYTLVFDFVYGGTDCILINGEQPAGIKAIIEDDILTINVSHNGQYYRDMAFSDELVQGKLYRCTIQFNVTPQGERVNFENVAYLSYFDDNDVCKYVGIKDSYGPIGQYAEKYLSVLRSSGIDCILKQLVFTYKNIDNIMDVCRISEDISQLHFGAELSYNFCNYFLEEGYMRMEEGKPVWWKGTAWVDATGANV